MPLAEFLRSLGYDTRPIPYPAVPRGQERIRVVVHAKNTEAELDDLITRLLEWAFMMAEEERKEKSHLHPRELAASPSYASYASSVRAVGLSKL